MVAHRPGNRLVEQDTDHFVHTAVPAGFTDAVREFLDGHRAGTAGRGTPGPQAPGQLVSTGVPAGGGGRHTCP